ncbi:mitochondrial carrier [Heliocybe sulcata]|uniref:Mitochondrial carrier n=1 Tax=Heliocybe sulcata TaxID=5364 RepID=A0A5C3N8K4_9AGAM|nr:mitochondrial carrier [Heliocybe sulcata]
MLESKKQLAGLSAGFFGVGVFGLYVTPRSNGAQVIPFVVCMWIGMGLFFAIGILLPFLNVVTRVTVYYAPNVIRLEGSEDEEAHILGPSEPAPTTYLRMRRRILRVEGKTGLIKGCLPFALKFLMLTVAYVLYAAPGIFGGYRGNPSLLHGTLLRAAMAACANILITLPFQVISTRCIVTPYQLPWSRPLSSLRLLLSEAELKKPWLLYAISGLLPALLLMAGVEVVYDRVQVVFFERYAILPPDGASGVIPLRVFLALATFGVKSVITIPLNMVVIRLSVQQTNLGGSIQLADPSPYLEESDSGIRKYSEDEDVVQLREEPYTGLVNCLRSIIREEGGLALYRGWMICLTQGVTLAWVLVIAMLQRWGVV